MRICIVYDCLFPHTVGGAERWYRKVAETLAAEGHEVTYLTLRQWDRGVEPGRRRASTWSRSARACRCTPTAGRRRIQPPLVFGLGVLAHLLRHGRRYDVVHTCSFPYFSLLAAGLLRPLRRATGSSSTGSRSGRATYWVEYLGGVGGRVGLARAARCARASRSARSASRGCTPARLRDAGLRSSR